MNSATSIANEAIRRRGFLVIGWHSSFQDEEPVPGRRLDRPCFSLGERIAPPFYVKAEVSVDDYIEQARVLDFPRTSLEIYAAEARRNYTKFFQLLAE